jgi:O6-methylguanine-DNA--protein-cysteine methyltransferase
VLTEEGGLIVRLNWGGEGVDDTPLLREAAAQLQDYFAGRRSVFDLPLAFQPGLTGAVQRAMLAIPLGETRRYGDLAKALGVPAQAIGAGRGRDQGRPSQA